MKINIANKAAVEAALGEANGRASAHCFKTQKEIVEIVCRAEIRLAAMGLPKKAQTGIEIIAVSGEAVSNAYAKKSFSRAAARVNIVRTSTGWFMTRCERANVGQQGGSENMILTPAQDKAAVAALRSTYSVAVA